MRTVGEKIAYARGLLDGGGIEKDHPSRTLFDLVFDVLEDINDEVEDIHGIQEEVEEYLDALDADLTELEEDLFGDDDDDDDDDDDCCCCDCEEELSEIDCPECEEAVYVPKSYLYDDEVEITCPDCGTVVFTPEEFDEKDLEA